MQTTTSLKLALMITVFCNFSCFAEPLPVKIPTRSEVIQTLLIAEFAKYKSPSLALKLYSNLNEQLSIIKIAEQTTYLAIFNNNLPLATSSSTKWASLDPNSEQANLISSLLLLQTYDYAKAEPFLKRIIHNAKDTAQIDLVILYQQLPEEKSKLNLITVLQKIAKQHNSQAISIPVNLALSEIYLIDGNYMRSLIATKEVLKLKKSARAIITHAQLQIILGQKDAALNFLEQALSNNNPRDLNISAYYIATLQQQQQSVKAKGFLNSFLVQKNTFDKNELMILAKLAFTTRQFEVAQQFLSSIKDEQKDHYSYFLLGEAYELTDNISEAILAYTQINYGELHLTSFLRAAKLLATSDSKSAISLLDTLEISSLEERKQIYLAKAEILYLAHNYTAAIQLLNSGLKILPEDQELWHLHGLTHIASGNISIAKNSLQQVLLQNNNHQETLALLGDINLNIEENLEDAFYYLTKAFNQNPNNSTILSNLGWLYHKIGQAEKAITLLTAANTLTPQDETVAVRLGTALWATGKQQDAIELWRKTLAYIPNSTILIAALSEHPLKNNTI